MEESKAVSRCCQSVVGLSLVGALDHTHELKNPYHTIQVSCQLKVLFFPLILFPVRSFSHIIMESNPILGCVVTYYGFNPCFNQQAIGIQSMFQSIGNRDVLRNERHMFYMANNNQSKYSIVQYGNRSKKMELGPYQFLCQVLDNQFLGETPG